MSLFQNTHLGLNDKINFLINNMFTSNMAEVENINL